MRYLVFAFLFAAVLGWSDDRPRLLVLTDIGGDPDDQQSMIRLMVYANAFSMEGLVASASGTPGDKLAPMTRPDLIREIVHAYGQVRPNLSRHEAGWPEAEALLDVVKSGNPYRGLDHIGNGHDTEGSRWITARVDAGSPARPLNITIWGGQYRRTDEGWYRDLPAEEGVDPRETVSRWRPEFQADFARRMAWCVTEE